MLKSITGFYLSIFSFFSQEPRKKDKAIITDNKLNVFILKNIILILNDIKGQAKRERLPKF
jgi:hypothetical protein